MVQCCIEVFVTSTCDGSTFSSPTTKICTLTSDNTPGAIQNLTLFHASPTSIVITWDNPANYQRRGLTFEITVNETASGSVVYQTSVQDVGNLDITGLAPISAYTLAITATNSAGDKEPSPTTLEFTTQLSPPPPPTSVSIAFVSVGDNITLRISWVDDTALEYNLTSHTVYSRCNGNTTTISVTSVAGQNSVNVSVPVTSDMWCAAQVQGQNDIGLGTLSELAEVYRPKIVPPTPRCFEDENLGSLLRVTFDVTDALSLEKYVTYGLTGPGRSAGEEKVYGPFRGYNNVTFRGLMRGAEYAFSLRMCNDVGCSENCEKDIATAITPPKPPDSIEVTNVNFSSATVQWNKPPAEDLNNIVFNFKLTNLLTKRSRDYQGIVGLNFSLAELRPATNYSIKIQTFDHVSNIMGMYSASTYFNTLVLPSTEPRIVDVGFNGRDMKLSISITAPVFIYGTPKEYSIFWSNTVNQLCDEPDGIMVNDSVPYTHTGFIYESNNTMNIFNKSEGALVCVQLLTDLTPGLWGASRLSATQVGGLSPVTSGDDTCGGTVAVGVVLALAVVTAVVLLVILAFTVVFMRRPEWLGFLPGFNKNAVTKTAKTPHGDQAFNGVGGGGGGGGGGEEKEAIDGQHHNSSQHSQPSSQQHPHQQQSHVAHDPKQYSRFESTESAKTDFAVHPFEGFKDDADTIKE